MASYPKQNLVSNCLNVETVPTGPDVPLEPVPTSDYTPEREEARIRPPPLLIFMEAVTKAELLWAMKDISSRWSKNSAVVEGELFQRMFPDSEIAKQFS